MGAISSKVLRRINRFNIENRAHRAIADPTPRPAPKYEVDVQSLEKLRKEKPSLEAELAKFDENLHQRLKQVYVTSKDVEPQQTVSNKPAPLSHKVRRTSDFGFDEAEDVTKGRILLKHCVAMLMTYAKNDKISIEDLAKQYEIKYEDTKNIIKYYHCFKLVIPDNTVDKEKYFNKLLFGREDGRFLTALEFYKEMAIKLPENTSLPKIKDSQTEQAKIDSPSDKAKLSNEEKSSTGNK